MIRIGARKSSLLILLFQCTTDRLLINYATAVAADYYRHFPSSCIHEAQFLILRVLLQCSTSGSGCCVLINAQRGSSSATIPHELVALLQQWKMAIKLTPFYSSLIKIKWELAVVRLIFIAIGVDHANEQQRHDQPTDLSTPFHVRHMSTFFYVLKIKKKIKNKTKRRNGGNLNIDNYLMIFWSIID